MLAKNRREIILNDGKLDDAKPNYLVALRNDFCLIRLMLLSHVEPYSPH